MFVGKRINQMILYINQILDASSYDKTPITRGMARDRTANKPPWPVSKRFVCSKMEPNESYNML